MRSIIRADRTERKVYSEIEAEERARFEAKSASTGGGVGGGGGQVDSASHREA